MPYRSKYNGRYKFIGSDQKADRLLRKLILANLELPADSFKQLIAVFVEDNYQPRRNYTQRKKKQAKSKQPYTWPS